MSLPKKILILTLSFGSGHVRAAEVIQRALQDGGDNVSVQVMDAIVLARAWFRWVYVHPYWWMLRYAPWMWRRLFERRLRKRHQSTAPAWVFRYGCVETLRRIRAFEPDLVITTEIGAVEIAALGRREGWFSAPILAVQPVHQVESPSARPEVDVHCVGTEEAKLQLVE